MFENNNENNHIPYIQEHDIDAFLTEFNIPITFDHTFISSQLLEMHHHNNPQSRENIGLLLQRFLLSMEGDCYDDEHEAWLMAALESHIDQPQLRAGLDVLIKSQLTMMNHLNCYKALIINNQCNLELINILVLLDQCNPSQEDRSYAINHFCSVEMQQYALYHQSLTKLLTNYATEFLPINYDKTDILSLLYKVFRISKLDELESTINSITMNKRHRKSLIRLINDYQLSGEYSNTLNEILKTLNFHNTNFDGHFSYIHKIADDTHNYSTHETIINRFLEMGLNLKDNERIFMDFSEEAAAESAIKLIPLLSSFGIKPIKDKAVFIRSLYAAASLTNLLQPFLRLNLEKKALRFLLNQIASDEFTPYQSPMVISALFEKLSTMDTSQPIPTKTIKLLTNEILASQKPYTAGPLNKSTATRQLEALLKRMTSQSRDTISIQFNPYHGYLLKLGDEETIYLSQLLRLANFDHILLSTEEATSLGNMIINLDPDFLNIDRNICENHHLLSSLPYSVQMTLSHYTSYHYKNINRLFRGLPLDQSKKYQWLSPTMGRDNLLINFIAGCLVNWVASTAPELLRKSKNRKLIRDTLLLKHPSPEAALNQWRNNKIAYLQELARKRNAGEINEETHATLLGLASVIHELFPQYGVIDRAENLYQSEIEGELATEKRRLANPQFMPSVTSFSTFGSGSAYFARESDVRTKIETSNATRPIINRSEGEILIPMGTSFYYEKGIYLGKPCFIGREVRSPDLTPKGGYASSAALVHAYDRALSQPYQDHDAKIALNGTTISRPNHGLAHTFRVMHYIDLIVSYFALHACDSNFKSFCEMITFEELELLRIAAAFSVTGRESEISAKENLKRYDEFRASCALHVEEFLSLHPIPWMNTPLKDRLMHIVRWMGNPRYEKPLDGEPAINQHEDLTEREIRSYYHRILTVAHKLDLPRCFDPHQFEDAMHLCRELSSPSLSQMSDYKNLLTYAISLIRAHGNALRTNISMEGELFACYLPYTSPFEMVSTNLRQCREMADTVPALKFMDSPQKESQKHASTPDSPRKLRK